MANKFEAFAPASNNNPSDKIKRAIRAITGSALSELVGSSAGASATDLRSRQALIDEFEKPLICLAAAYLTGMAEKNTSTDPVARFHLNNGAKLDRLNWRADESDKGLRQSLGMMVNYVYEPRRIESNHEKFVRGVTVTSKQVQALL